MPFKKDDPRINRKGRKAGTPNKTTEELRGLFQSFIEANIDTLQADFDQLEPKDRLSFIERLARLVLPTPNPQETELAELIEKLKQHESKFSNGSKKVA
jgi:hypothetical protein